MTHRAYIGLGSNLGDREGRLRTAVSALGKTAGISVAAASAIYVSAPVGAAEPQPDYFNAVVAIDTTLAPRALLDALQRIEHDAGRARVAGERNTARTLDLDILLYGDLQSADATLTLPHPRLHERAFVLLPLAELAPERVLPQWLASVRGQAIERWDETGWGEDFRRK